MKEMWDKRYADKDYAYGIEANDYFKIALNKFDLSGKSILMPAEGEGRNAVYAAKKGLLVTAFDISEAGKSKALRLAAKENVSINYEVGDFFELDLINHQYEAAALIYAHFPPVLLSKYYRKIGDLIKEDGLIILEGFSKKNLKYREKNPAIGGPNQIEFLFSKDSIISDFPNFEIVELAETEVALNEGKYHVGTGSVIRFIGRKKQV